MNCQTSCGQTFWTMGHLRVLSGWQDSWHFKVLLSLFTLMHNSLALFHRLNCNICNIYNNITILFGQHHNFDLNSVSVYCLFDSKVNMCTQFKNILLWKSEWISRPKCPNLSPVLIQNIIYAPSEKLFLLRWDKTQV